MISESSMRGSDSMNESAEFDSEHRAMKCRTARSQARVIVVIKKPPQRPPHHFVRGIYVVIGKVDVRQSQVSPMIEISQGQQATLDSRLEQPVFG